MIYFFRTLWVMAYVPVFIIESISLLVGFLLWPFIGAYYYIRHGTTANMKFSPDTLPSIIDEQYQKLRKYIEKQNQKTTDTWK